MLIFPLYIAYYALKRYYYSNNTYIHNTHYNGGYREDPYQRNIYCSSADHGVPLPVATYVRVMVHLLRLSILFTQKLWFSLCCFSTSPHGIILVIGKQEQSTYTFTQEEIKTRLLQFSWASKEKGLIWVVAEPTCSIVFHTVRFTLWYGQIQTCLYFFVSSEIT